MEREIGRRMTAGTRGGQGEVQWGRGRWNGRGLWRFWGCWQRGWRVSWVVQGRVMSLGLPPALCCPLEKKIIIKLSLILPQRWSDKPDRGDVWGQGGCLYPVTQNLMPIPMRLLSQTSCVVLSEEADKTCEKPMDWGCVGSAGVVEVSEDHWTFLCLWTGTRKQAASPFWKTEHLTRGDKTSRGQEKSLSPRDAACLSCLSRKLHACHLYFWPPQTLSQRLLTLALVATSWSKTLSILLTSRSLFYRRATCGKGGMVHVTRVRAHLIKI